MVCDTYYRGSSPIHRLDPRVRIVSAAAASAVVAASDGFATLAAGLTLALGLALAARLPAWPTLKRLAAMNGFMALLWLTLPVSSSGGTALAVGPITFHEAGLLLAGRITLKGNAILLTLTALLSTIETVELGHALRHLKIPAKLVHLLLLAVRYLDVLHHESQRLIQAMKVRCFRPRVSVHTFRSLGNLVGMLLVRSLDRAHRILSAMKCRGFRGEFYAFDHFAAAPRDAVFGTLLAAVLGGLVFLELR